MLPFLTFADLNKGLAEFFLRNPSERLVISPIFIFEE